MIFLPISSELHFVCHNGAIFSKWLFPLRRPLLQNLMDPTTKPYGSNSKNFKICYPPLVRVQYKIKIQNLTTFFGLLPFDVLFLKKFYLRLDQRLWTRLRTILYKFYMKDGRMDGKMDGLFRYICIKHNVLPFVHSSMSWQPLPSLVNSYPT